MSPSAIMYSQFERFLRLLSKGNICFGKGITRREWTVLGLSIKRIWLFPSLPSWQVLETKSKPFPKQILPLLKSLKKRSNCEYIIADGDKPVFVRSYQRTFELLLKKLGIAHKGFHSLRHTFATRALECGMDVKTLSELLGHKNATVTLNRYAHSLLEHKTDMMNRLGKLL